MPLTTRRRVWTLAAAAAAVVALAAVALATWYPGRPEVFPVTSALGIDPPPPTPPRHYPLVFGHRGAADLLPEHTLAGYQLAIDLGVDYVEPDLVLTRDGVLVARHENELSATTDVAEHPEFAQLRRTKMIEGVRVTGWFAEDFTFAQLETLRCMERIPTRLRSAAHNGEYHIPSLQQIIDLIRADEHRTHRRVGLYVEIKLASYYHSLGLSPERLLVTALRHNQLDRPGARVFLESFYPASLQYLHARLPALPAVRLVLPGPAGDQATSPTALRQIRQYATGVGVDRSRLAGLIGTARTDPGTNLVTEAHQLGLEIHVYTFADDTVPASLPAQDFRANDPPALARAMAEYRAYYALGVDGVFSDDPDVAVAARTSMFRTGR